MVKFSNYKWNTHNVYFIITIKGYKIKTMLGLQPAEFSFNTLILTSGQVYIHLLKDICKTSLWIIISFWNKKDELLSMRGDPFSSKLSSIIQPIKVGSSQLQFYHVLSMVYSFSLLREYEDFAVNGVQKLALCSDFWLSTAFTHIYQPEYRWNRSEIEKIMN